MITALVFEWYGLVEDA